MHRWPIAVLALFTLARAEAAFPGANGKLVYSRGYLGRGLDVFRSSLVPQGQGKLTDNILTSGPITQTAFIHDAQHATWSADGTKIAYMQRDEVPGVGIFHSIRTMYADGSGEATVTSYSDCGRPTWSPDGTRIAFHDSYPGPERIVVVNANGTGVTVIRDSGSDPTWSPDGSRILFVDYETDGESVLSALFTMNPDGTGVTQLTAFGSAGSPAWSPDSQRIVYFSAGGTFIMNADGSGATLIFNEVGAAPGLVWSPDGERIAFFLNDPDVGDLMIAMINPDGSGLSTLRPSTFCLAGIGGPNDWNICSPFAFGMWSGLDWQALPGGPDLDGDGVVDPVDNCVAGANPGQGDADHDGIGDLCDADTDESFSGVVAGGSTVTTDAEADGATAADPIETSVSVPNGGIVTVAEMDTPPPDNLQFLARQVIITAPAASVEFPLVLLFRLDTSILSASPPNDIRVFKDRALVAPCSGGPGMASPDPCESSLAILADGDLQLEVLTSSASTWNFGVPSGGTSAPRPVPDGFFVSGTPMTVQKNGSLLDITWDVTSCVASPAYNVYAGTLGSFSLVTETVCALTNTGTATIGLAGESVWFVLAGTDSSSVGSFGRNSQGGERVLTAWETACAEFSQDNSQTCP